LSDLTAYDQVKITVTDPAAGALAVTIDGTPLSGCPPSGEDGPCEVVLTVTDVVSGTALSNTLTLEYCP